MATVASMAVRVSANTTQFNTSLKKSQAMIDGFSNSMKRLGTVATVGLTVPMVAVGKNMINSAMEAVESENLFKESMGSMADSARSWSEEMQTALGLNGFELRKNVGMLNAMMNSMGLTEKSSFEMSKGLVELSHDMASFYNISQSDALQKLQAGITGEAEPLKRLGILVNENTIKNFAYANGIARLGEKLTEQQKVTARYGTIMEQTSKAQGDLARTMDSPANRLRILKERFNLLGIEIGMEMIPIMMDLLDTFDPMLQALFAMDDSTKRLTIQIGLFVAVLGPMMLLLSPIAKIIGLVVGALASLSPPVLIAVGVITALIVAFTYLWNTSDTFKAKVTEMYESVMAKTSEWGTFLKSWIQDRIPIAMKFLGESAKWLGDRIGSIWEWIKTTTSTVWGFITPYLFKTWELIKSTATRVWESLLKFWQTNGENIMLAFQLIWDFLVETWNGIWNTIVTISTYIWDFLSPWLEDIWVLFELAWKGIENFIGTTLDVILGLVGAFIALFTGDWGLFWTNMKNVVMAIWDGIKNGIIIQAQTLWVGLENVFQGIGNMVNRVWTSIKNTAIGHINSIIDKVNGLISKINDVSGMSIPTVSQLSTGSTNTDSTGAFASEGLTKFRTLSQQSTNVTTQVVLDGKVVAQSTNKYLGNNMSLGAN